MEAKKIPLEQLVVSRNALEQWQRKAQQAAERYSGRVLRVSDESALVHPDRTLTIFVIITMRDGSTAKETLKVAASEWRFVN